jgi:flagellar basal-body rod modification protein FlgD
MRKKNMIISGTDSISASGMGPATLPSKVLDKDDFLNLLITQLQNQDPLKPTDSVEFTAQLAQFSSLEQLSNVNDNLEHLQNYQASINNSQAVALIGKDVTAKGNSLQLTDGEPVGCNFNLEASAAVVMMSIYDSTGEFVKSFEGQNLTAGQHTLHWDGLDKDGNQVSDGIYAFEILAADAEGQNIKATTLFSGIIDKVMFENNQAYLLSGDHKIALGDVIRVGLPVNSVELDNQQ